MTSGIRIGRVVGLFLLLVFALGVLTFQVLQTPVLSGPEHINEVVTHSTQLVASAIVGLLSGAISIGVAVLLLPVFRRSSETLATIYLAFAVVNFVAIAIDNVSVLSLLELSRVVSEEGSVADGLVPLLYGRQRWTHYLYLLISCLPVLFLYSGLYASRAVPRALALFGVVATVLFAVEVVGVMLGSGLSDLLFIPIALVQMAMPLWLLARGLALDDLEIRP